VFERFTDRARSVLTLAQGEVGEFNHGYLGTEHLLLGLVREGEGVAAQALGSFGVTLDAARAQVREIVGVAEHRPRGSPPFTPRAKKVLELSRREALQLGHNYIGTEHLLLGLVREGEGAAVQILINLGVEVGPLRQQVIALMSGGSRVADTSVSTPGAWSTAEPLCPQCHAPVTEGARYRTLEVLPGPGEEDERPARVMVVYCGTCGISLHTFPSPPT
jgi:ATP-dependent Clp protease ATP-binding subunit ClpC